MARKEEEQAIKGLFKNLMEESDFDCSRVTIVWNVIYLRDVDSKGINNIQAVIDVAGLEDYDIILEYKNGVIESYKIEEGILELY